MLTIIDTKAPQKVSLGEIPAGTVFTGRIGGLYGTYYKHPKVVVKLDPPDSADDLYTGVGNLVVEDYRPREAELVLGRVLPVEPF